MTGGRACARASPMDAGAETAGGVADGCVGARGALRGPRREAGGAGTPGSRPIGAGTPSTAPRDYLLLTGACCEAAMIDVA